ncbi:TrlF family AAA-like ATPase [Elizabethkingia anophelis]|uniref:TrlF family AAA-like ATPase n=1 Tax=Elizabethkingia anophelis TaxID=1117645 RepID=UPI00293CFFCE|nr:hypothetical protein [Elizabethkingia anophelis]
MTINRGSEWRKWDLHFHTPSSYDYKDKSTTNEEIIEILKQNNISVVAITDHHIIDVKRIKELQKLGLERNITVFPGIEFLSDSRGEEPIHFIAIFSESCDIDFIWKQIENKTNISRIQGEKKEYNEVYCNLLETAKLIKELGGIVTIHAGNKTNGIENITHSLPHGVAQKEDIAQIVDIFEMGKESDCEGYSKHVIPYLVNKIQKHIPLIICSDNHKIKEYTIKQNLWIKAQPTFEGLKQVIYEPIERIKIQKEMPEAEKLSNLMISKVTFTSSKKRFTSNPIYLNKNLNVIIGGKSSGKSILLYEIAKTLYPKTKLENLDQDVLKYKDSKDNKYKDLYDLSEISDTEKDSNFNFQIDLFSGSKQTLKDRDTNSSILSGIKYIPQNHLSNLVDKSRKNGATLKKIIRDLVLEDNNYKKKYDDFVEQAKRNDIQRNQDIDFYFSLVENLNNKENDKQSKGNITALEESIDFNKKKIDELNKGFTKEELLKYNKLNDELSILKIRKAQINSDYDKLNNYQFDLQRFLAEYSNKKRIILDSLENITLKNEYSSKLNFIDEALININEISREFTKNDKGDYLNETLFAKEYRKVNSEIEQTHTSLKVYNEKVENQKQIEALQNSISSDNTKIMEIEQFQKEIDVIKQNIKDQKKKIFNDFKNNFSLYEKIKGDSLIRISNIQQETDKIEIIPTIQYNFPNFRKMIEDTFNMRSFNNDGFEYLYQNDQVDNKSALSEIDYLEIEKALYSILKKIEDKEIFPKGGNKEVDACKKIFTDFFFDHWDVKSQGDDIHKMSTGKASLVLLKLIIKLSTDNGPILIDQPEDNLDNRSVSKELVEYLKEKKKDRQIILVTHNPNIVVNADAENIIVANQKNQVEEGESEYDFDYINGALEDSFEKNNNEKDLLKSMGIREHIAEIVEGGKEAFKKREEKYSFKQ